MKEDRRKKRKEGGKKEGKREIWEWTHCWRRVMNNNVWELTSGCGGFKIQLQNSLTLLSLKGGIASSLEPEQPCDEQNAVQRMVYDFQG